MSPCNHSTLVLILLVRIRTLIKATDEDLNALKEDMSPTASQDSTAATDISKLTSQKQQLL